MTPGRPAQAEIVTAPAPKIFQMGPETVSALYLVMVINDLGVDPEKLFTVKELQAEIMRLGCGRLAKELGVSRQELQRIANGERQPSERILNLMGVRRFVFYANAGDLDQSENRAVAKNGD